jgi:hypothetical protein
MHFLQRVIWHDEYGAIMLNNKYHNLKLYAINKSSDTSTYTVYRTCFVKCWWMRWEMTVTCQMTAVQLTESLSESQNQDYNQSVVAFVE